MSWSASGPINGKFTASDVNWSPLYEDLSAEDRAQADHAVAMVNAAFDGGAVAGPYSLSLQGSTDHSGDDVAHGEGGGRLHLYLNMTPTTPAPVGSVTEEGAVE